MGGVGVEIYSDPACPWSWAAEPALMRVRVQFGEELRITYVMGGLARKFARPAETLRHWLDARVASSQPVDGRQWLDAAPSSSYPACLAVVAAREQALDGAMLRALRLGFAVGRARLDTTDALVEAARGVAGLDVARFRIALGSSAVVEAFGADLDRARAAGPPELRGDAPRVAFPSACFTGADGAEHWAYDSWSPDAWHDAAVAAGAVPSGERPDPLAALRRFGALTTPEVAAACGLPGPLAPARLWTLATEFRVREDAGVWRAA